MEGFGCRVEGLEFEVWGVRVGVARHSVIFELDSISPYPKPYVSYSLTTSKANTLTLYHRVIKGDARSL